MSEQELKADIFEAEKLALDFCRQYEYEAGTREHEIAVNAFCVGYRHPRLFRADELSATRIYGAGYAVGKRTRPSPDDSAVAETAGRHDEVAQTSTCTQVASPASR
jgi:hypothetical protein